jgi:hypothetical protein
MRHFDRIKGWSGVAPFDMAIIPIFFLWTWPPLSNKKLQMLFDDKSENVDVEWWQGAFQFNLIRLFLIGNVTQS